MIKRHVKLGVIAISLILISVVCAFVISSFTFETGFEPTYKTPPKNITFVHGPITRNIIIGLQPEMNLSNEDGDLVLTIDGKKVVVKLNVNSASFGRKSKQTFRDFKKNNNDVSLGIVWKKVDVYVDECVKWNTVDQNNVFCAEKSKMLSDQIYYKFSWNITGLSQNEINKLESYEIEVVSDDMKIIKTDIGYEVGGVVIDLRDLQSSGFDLRKSTKGFEIGSKTNSIKQSSLYLDPTVYTGDMDTWIDDGTPNDNYGVDTTLQFDNVDSALVYFDWHDGQPFYNIPYYAIVNYAYVRVYFLTASTGDVKTIYPIQSDWDEGTGNGIITGDGATYNNRTGSALWNAAGMQAGTDYNNTAGYTATQSGGTGWQQWDVAAWVRDTTNETHPNYGFALRNSDGSNHIFSSRETSTEANRPVMNISFTYPSAIVTHNTIVNNSVTSTNTLNVNCTADMSTITPYGNISYLDIFIDAEPDWATETMVDGDFRDLNETSDPLEAPTVTWNYTSIALDDGDYYVICGVDEVFEDISTSVGTIGSDEYKVTVDTTNPNLTFVDPTPTIGEITHSNSETINITFDDLTKDTCILILNDTSTVTNYTMTEVGNYCNYSFATVDGTTYYYQVWANDSAGHSSITVLRNFTENAPPTIPSITLSPATVYQNDTLSCSASGSTDPDGDPITYLYEWYNATALLQNSNTSQANDYSATAIQSGAWNAESNYWRDGSIDTCSVVNSNSDPLVLLVNFTIPKNLVNYTSQVYQVWSKQGYGTYNTTYWCYTNTSSWYLIGTDVAEHTDVLNFNYTLPSSCILGKSNIEIKHIKDYLDPETGANQLCEDNMLWSLNSTMFDCNDYSQCLKNTVVNCSVRTYDTYDYSGYNSTNVTISNFVPVIASWNVSNSTWSNSTGTNLDIYENATNGTYTFNITSVTDIDTGDSRWYDWFIDGVKKTVTAVNSWFNWILGSDAVGSHNVTVYVNDSSNAQDSQYWNITIHDVTNPIITLVSPADNSWHASTNISVNFTYFDVHPQTCWYTNNSGATNTTISSCANTSILLGEGTGYNITVYINDTSNNINSDASINIGVDITKPLIDWGTGIGAGGANLSQSWIYANVSWTEVNFKNITFTLKNDTATVNATTFTTATYSLNWTNLVDNNYTYYVNITDQAGNTNGTTLRYITIDDTNPSATQTSPANNSYNSTTSHNFTASVSDNRGIKNVTLFIYNQSNDLINQTTVTYTTSVTSTVVGVVVNLVEGVFKWFYKVFDWSGNSYTTDNRTITIDQTKPLISYNPSTTANGSWVTDGIIVVNVSSSDTNANTTQFQWQGVNETFASSFGNNYWETKTGLATGTYTFYGWTKDLALNFNSTEVRTIYVDRENPTVSINLPLNINYNVNESLPLNISFSDTNLQACWYNFNNGANTTITCGQNYTFNISEGSHTVYAYANDSSGRVGSDTQLFTVNLAPPSTVLDYPTDTLWLNTNSVQLNWTSTDTDGISSCELWGNWTGTWHKNETVTGITSGVQVTRTKTIADSSYLWNVQCNDTGNNWAWGNPTGNNTFQVDATYPLISYTANALADLTNTTATNIFVEVSVTESNEDTITFSLYNNTGVVNSTSFIDSTRSINWTNLPDATYYFNVTINDSANNINYTATRTINLDDTNPIITIDSPQPINYGYNNSINLNYTVTDNLVGIDSCWFTVENSTGSVIIATTTLATCENTTISVPSGDIDYTLTFYANDSNGNEDNVGIFFGVRMIDPAVVIDNPTTNQHFNRLTNIPFNFTTTDPDNEIDTCQLWGNWTGTWHLNQSVTSVTTAVQKNFTSLNLTEATFLMNIWCNDSYGNSDWALNNRTFTTDITYPLVDITTADGAAVSTTFDLSYTISDTHIDGCYYRIDDGAWLTLSCSATTKSLTLAAGTYNVSIWGIDYATNSNTSIITLTTSAPGAPPGGTGGGDTTPDGNLSWGMYTNEQMTSTSYKFEMVGGSIRNREIYFYNDEAKEVKIDLTCQDGEMCQYLTLDRTNVTLPVQQGVPTVIKFKLELPADIESGSYVVNIQGIDQDKKPQVITITTNVGAAGMTIEAFTKLGAAKDVFGIPIPYVIISFFVMVLTFVLFNYVFLRKIKLGLPLSIVVAFFMGIFILFVL